MISSIGLYRQPQYPPVSQGSEKAPGNGGQLTTVTTHCDKNHKHTKECPHTVTARPVEKAVGKGGHLDVYA